MRDGEHGTSADAQVDGSGALPGRREIVVQPVGPRDGARAAR